MSIEGVVKEGSRPPEHQRLKAELEVGFHNWVAQQTGLEHLKASPFLSESGTVSSGWSKDKRLLNRKVAGWSEIPGERVRKSAGKLAFDHQTRTWSAVDKTSPIGQIEALQQRAQTALESSLDEAQKKLLESEIRKEFVGIYNGYAGERFNLERDVVDGKDFRGLNLQNLVSRSLPNWRMDLVRTRKQSIEPIFFDRWETENKSIKTPSRADEYIYVLYQELAREEQSKEAQLFKELLNLKNAEGYKACANIFCGGDMLKTFQNLSAVAQMTGQHLPDGWQSFSGSTKEFTSLQARLQSVSDGVTGYLAAADALYGGDMNKTYQNLSAVAQMTGQRLPDGWQGFKGSTTEFITLQTRLQSVSDGVTGYLAAADALYGGDMLKTFQNLSAVAQMTGQHLPDGWQSFSGSTKEFYVQQEWVEQNLSTDVETFMRQFEIKTTKKARQNLAAIKNMLSLTHEEA